MTLHSKRGDVILVVVGLLSLITGIFFGTWKPFAGLHKPPPTKELTVLQAEYATYKVDAAAREKALKDAQKADFDRLINQLRSAQQGNVGTAEALRRVAPEHQVAEVKLASRLANRVSLQLVDAIGKLPQEQQDAILEIVDQALSDKQAEVDKANARLAQMDVDFKAVTQEREQIKAQIPILEQQAKDAQAKANAKEAEVAAKTEEVKTWADKKDAADKQAGSFFASFAKARRFLFVLGGIAALLGAVVLYLRMGLGSVGKALHPLQSVLSPEDYQKVVAHLDSETDKLHQWLIRGGRLKATALSATQTKP